MRRTTQPCKTVERITASAHLDSLDTTCILSVDLEVYARSAGQEVLEIGLSWVYSEQVEETTVLHHGQCHYTIIADHSP